MLVSPQMFQNSLSCWVDTLISTPKIWYVVVVKIFTWKIDDATVVLMSYLQDGNTPLHIAVKYGSIDMLMELLLLKPNTNAKNKACAHFLYNSFKFCKTA